MYVTRHFRPSTVLVATAALSLATLGLHAQATPTQAPPTVEAITIKASAQNGGPAATMLGGGGGGNMVMRTTGPAGTFSSGTSIDPGRVTMTNVSLTSILLQVFGLKSYQLIAPDWMNSVRFDLTATMTGPVPRDQILALLQPEIIRQFKIVSHSESRNLPNYQLTVAKGGPKLQPASPADIAAASNSTMPPGVMPGVRMGMASGGDMSSGPPPKPPAGGTMMSFGPNGLHLESASTDIPRLIAMLTPFADRPIFDATGLNGKYNIKLDFTPTPGTFSGPIAMGAAPGAAGSGAIPEASDPNPSLFTALQQQLGLKLEPQTAGATVLVIEHAEKAPTGGQ